jgi:DNA-binding MarR family transcriptional regulator
LKVLAVRMTGGEQEISASAARAAHDLRVVFGRLRRRFKDLADNRGLTPSQASVLSRLGKEGDASASDLAAAERVRPQAVAPTLAVLEERGLIERRPDPDDGRRQLISLSPAGRAVFEDTRRVGEEWLTRAMQEHYSEAERQTLIEAMALLERVTRH